MLQDAGWQQVLQYSGWHYFRKPVAAGEQAGIYTDVESKIAEYLRLLLYLCAMAAPGVLILVLLLDTMVSPVGMAFVGLLILMILLEAFLVASMRHRYETLTDRYGLRHVANRSPARQLD